MGKKKLIESRMFNGFPTSFPHVLFSNNWRRQGDSDLHFGFHTWVQNYCRFRNCTFYVILLRTYNLCNEEYRKLDGPFNIIKQSSFTMSLSFSHYLNHFIRTRSYITPPRSLVIHANIINLLLLFPFRILLN